jgi:hypothetical protein
VAREAARNDDNLAASKLRNLNRWRKNKRVTDLAKIDLMLGIDSARSTPVPTLKEILRYLNDMGDSLE